MLRADLWLFLSSRGLLVLASLSAPALAQAQVDGPGNASQAVVQTVPNNDSMNLNAALARLGRNPRDLQALIDAGQAALAIGDVDAAIGFYSRAEQVMPGTPRVKAGLARALLRSGNPFDALPLFQEAEKGGAVDSAVALDRGLAYDLVADNASAQRYYRQALAAGPNDEATRRLAISLAIAGDKRGSSTALAPLLARQDKAGWRARAFALAISGQADEAISVINGTLPPQLAAGIAPYLRYMPRLTPAQQAAAANFGQFPRASEIGRDDPRVALYAPAGTRRPALASGEAGLIPRGEPLGRNAKSRDTRTASRSRGSDSERQRPPEIAMAQPAPQPVPQPARQPAPASNPGLPPRPPQMATASPARPTETRAAMAAAAPQPMFPPKALAPPPAEQPAAVRPAPARVVSPPVTAPPATSTPRPGTALASTSLAQTAARPAPAPVFAASAAAAPAASPPRAPAATPVASAAASPAATPAASPAAPPVPASPPPAASPARPTVPAAVAAVRPPPAARTSAPVPPAPRRVSLAEAFSDLSQLKADVTPTAGAVDIRRIRPAREPATGAAATARPVAPSHPSRIWVQLATGRDRSALSFDWRRMARQAEAVFKNRRPSTSVWGQANRLLAGPFESEAAASAFLAQLRRADVDGAFVWTSPAGQVVDALAVR